jgi:tripartite ATP-independent transporter DctM subunit
MAATRLVGSFVDTAIGRITEPIAAALLVVEVAILLSGVVSRYLFHHALVWTDEVATILMLWLSMLGAVIAFRRHEHMRLTALARMIGGRAAQWFDAVVAVIVATFALEMLPASQKLMVDDLIDMTAVLNLPRSYIIAAIFVGMLLLLALSIVRLLAIDRGIVVRVILGSVVVVAAFFFARPLFATLGNVDLVIFFVFVVGGAIAIGTPIALAFGFGTLTYIMFATTVPLEVVVSRMDEGASNIVLLAIPMFILLGYLIVSGGIAKRLVAALAALVGHFRGGLGIVLVFAMYVVSGISGSKTADMAAVAPVLFPEMRRRGSEPNDLIAMLASAGAMAETIPPSLVLIIIGSVTGVSIGALFTAGLMPALLAAACLLVVILVRSRGDKVELAKRATLREIGIALFAAIPGFALPFLIRAAVLGGVATATEVSTVGIAYAIVVGTLVYRELRWRDLYPLLRETAALTGAIMLIIATATAMGWALTQSGFAQQLTDGLGHAPGGAAGFMALSAILFVILGSVLEGIPAVVLFGPLLFPIAKSFGIDEVQYAMVAVLGMGVGLFAPPLGFGYYAACALGRVSPDTAMRRMVPYLSSIVVALVIVAAVPWFSTGFLHR